MRSLGREVVLSNPSDALGSTDMGNVSHLVPSIHPYVAVAGKEILIHSPQFAAAAAAEAGIKGMLDAAKALAMIVVDLVANPDIVTKIKKEFEQEND